MCVCVCVFDKDEYGSNVGRSVCLVRKSNQIKPNRSFFVGNLRCRSSEKDSALLRIWLCVCVCVYLLGGLERNQKTWDQSTTNSSSSNRRRRRRMITAKEVVSKSIV